MPVEIDEEKQKEWLLDHNFKLKFGGKKEPHTTDGYVRYR